MRARRLFLAAGVTLAFLIGFNVLIHDLAQRTQRRRLLAVLDRIPTTTQCLFLGNSLVEAGCDPAAFATGWAPVQPPPAAVNLGLGAASPVEHYLILKRAFRRPLHPKLLVYGFFDDQLVAPVSGDWADLVGNRALSYYFPDDAARLYDPGSRLAAWRLWLVGRVPMLAERSSLWDKVELFRRRLESVGMPRKATNRYGRVADFAALEPADAASFDRRCLAILQERQAFSPAIKAILQLARDHGVRVFLVEMPMSPEHRAHFYASPSWEHLRSYLESLAGHEDVTYVRASDWVTDRSEFEDSIHLNERGARDFSTQLGAAIFRLTQSDPPASESSIAKVSR